MPIDQSVRYVFLFDSNAKELLTIPRADLTADEAEYKIGRVPNFVNHIMFFQEGLHIYGLSLKYQGRLTKLGKMVGMCNDVHVRMREGETIPLPRKQVELRYW